MGGWLKEGAPDGGNHQTLLPRNEVGDSGAARAIVAFAKI